MISRLDHILSILPLLVAQDQVVLDERQVLLRLTAAGDWIKMAHQVTENQGISKGYNILADSWYPTYPETTGYTIPTLLNTAIILKDSSYNDLALHLANYLLGRVSAEGGVTHWQENIHQQPVVFDTGQIIFGWIAAYDFSKDEKYLQAAERAGDWLVVNQDPSGAWKNYQHLGVVKVIDTRVSWSLLELNKRLPKSGYVAAATRNLDWAKSQQDSDGWYNNCAFTVGGDPFTHTIAYTAEGLLEASRILNSDVYFEAARKTVLALLKLQKSDGSHNRSYQKGWEPVGRSSCLTGECQIARLCLLMYEKEGDQTFFNAAKRAIEFVSRHQLIKTKNMSLLGGIPGSYPIFGKYERIKFPNWATKFYMDALIAFVDAKLGGQNSTVYVG